MINYLKWHNHKKTVLVEYLYNPFKRNIDIVFADDTKKERLFSNIILE